MEALTKLTAFRGFAGTSVLIIVGVATDTARKVRTVTRHCRDCLPRASWLCCNAACVVIALSFTFLHDRCGLRWRCRSTGTWTGCTMTMARTENLISTPEFRPAMQVVTLRAPVVCFIV